MITNSKDIHRIGEHIYVTDDSAYKEEDWIITETATLIQVRKPEKGYSPTGKRVIATTDPSLGVDVFDMPDEAKTIESIEWEIEEVKREQAGDNVWVENQIKGKGTQILLCNSTNGHSIHSTGNS